MGAIGILSPDFSRISRSEIAFMGGLRMIAGRKRGKEPCASVVDRPGEIRLGEFSRPQIAPRTIHAPYAAHLQVRAFRRR